MREITREQVLETINNYSDNCHDEIVKTVSLFVNPPDGTYRYTSPEGGLGKTLSLSTHAESQLLSRLEIPVSYFRRCPSPMRSVNVNYWINQSRGKKLLLRFHEGVVRGILSSRFTITKDDKHVFPTILSSVEEDMKLESFEKDEEMSILRVRLPHIITQKDFSLVAGITVVNSEVGMSSIIISPVVGYGYNNDHYWLGDNIGEGVTRIRHVGDLNEENLTEAFRKAGETAQLGIVTALEKDVNYIEKPIERVRSIVEDTTYIPNSILVVLEDEYRDMEISSELDITMSILKKVRELPAVESRLVQRTKIESYLGSCLGLFHDLGKKVEQFIAVM
jgi:hypothetical protein